MDAAFELPTVQIGRGAYIKQDEPVIEPIELADPSQIESPIDELSIATDDAEAVNEELTETGDKSVLQKTWEVIKRNKVTAVAGAITVASLVTNPLGETISALGEAAPYAIPSVVIGEVGWIGGAAMMFAASGKKVISPLKLRSSINDLFDDAPDSKLFKAGFAINLVSAVGQVAIPSYAICSSLPWQSWGILACGAIDLWATYVTRKALWKNTQSKSDETV